MCKNKGMNKVFAPRWLPDGSLVVKNDAEQSLMALLEKLGLSRGLIRRLQIEADGRPVTNTGTILPAGARVLLKPAEQDFSELSYEPVDIIYEDDECLVAFKPAGLLVHADGEAEDTLTGRVNAHLLGSSPFPAQCVHRIDKDASGLVLFAKNPLVQPALDAQFAGTDAKKEYLAVIEGKPAHKHVDLNSPIGKDRHNPNQMVVFSGGKPSHTHIELESEKRGNALVKATITTGRRHQIRVHLAHNGHPIVGDVLYGARPTGEPMLLQCQKLAFTNPITEERIQVEAPFPARFAPFHQGNLKN